MGPEAVARVAKYRQQKSPWPEAKWRAAGLKVAPSPGELRYPAYGCCAECGIIMMRIVWKPGLRLWILCAIVAAVLGGFVTMLSILTR